MTTVSLTSPIQHDGQEVTSLTFREAIVDDLIAASDNGLSTLRETIFILARLSGISSESFGRISARDLRSIMVATKDMLGNEPDQASGGE